MENIEKELENFESLKYRIREEGLHYTLMHYSNWIEIDDKEFQELKRSYCNMANKVEFYVEEKIIRLNKIISQSKDILLTLREFNSDAVFLDIPAGVVTKSYETFLDDVREHPNSLFHFYPDPIDNENLFWYNNTKLRYKITNK